MKFVDARSQLLPSLTTTPVPEGFSAGEMQRHEGGERGQGVISQHFPSLPCTRRASNETRAAEWDHWNEERQE